MATDDDGHLLSLKECAELFGLSTKTLYRWRKRPGFPIERQGEGSSLLVDPDKVRDWAERTNLTGKMGKPIGAINGISGADPSGVGVPGVPLDPGAGKISQGAKAEVVEALEVEPAKVQEVAAQLSAEIKERLEDPPRPRKKAEKDAEPLDLATITEQLAAAELRKRKADADLKEIEAAKRRGELLNALDVERGLMRRISTVKAGLLALPGKLAARLQNRESRFIQEEIEREVEQLLQLYADKAAS